MATLTEMEIRQPEKNGREVTVEIRFDGEIHVDAPNDPFWVSKKDNEEVRWILKGGDGKFLVDFGHDSPFYESQFSQDSPVSGLVRRDVLPNSGRLYKYTVWVGGKKLDPGGGVRP